MERSQSGCGFGFFLVMSGFEGILEGSHDLFGVDAERSGFVEAVLGGGHEAMNDRQDFQARGVVQAYWRPFSAINTALLGLAVPHSQVQMDENVRRVFGSEAGLVAMRFIAFAYTYHYLNWFSKKVLFCLSFLHVFLEFPLNHMSIVGVFRQLPAFRMKRPLSALKNDLLVPEIQKPTLLE